MKTYLVNEVFHSIQGEGFWSGRAAVFVRFSLCNLWTGHEKDRARAVCTFCDTDFRHGDRYTLEGLVDAVGDLGGGTAVKPMVVFTGGEPTLQLDEPLIDVLHNLGYYLAIETNGTRMLPAGLD